MCANISFLCTETKLAQEKKALVNHFSARHWQSLEHTECFQKDTHHLGKKTLCMSSLQFFHKLWEILLRKIVIHHLLAINIWK